MEIVKSKNADYVRYEELLVLREKVEKEASFIELRYLNLFGQDVLELYKLQISCIECKKRIGYCQACINRNDIIDIDSLEIYIQKEMQMYKRKLEELIAKCRQSRSLTVLSKETMTAIKKLYRKLAKMLHPDLHPFVQGNKALLKLWQRIVDAYRWNDLEMLEELEVLVKMKLENLQNIEIDINIPHLQEKIKKLEKEIDDITTSEPYTYKEIIESPFKIYEKQKELNEEIEKYRTYLQELEQVLQELLPEEKEKPCLMS